MATSKTTNGKKDPVNLHIGNKLRIARALYGFTPEKLGKRVCLSAQQIQAYEHGMDEISAKNLYELSIALSVPIAYFFDDIMVSK